MTTATPRALWLRALAFDRADPAGDASGHVRSGRPDEQQPGRIPRLGLLLPGVEADAEAVNDVEGKVCDRSLRQGLFRKKNLQ